MTEVGQGGPRALAKGPPNRPLKPPQTPEPIGSLKEDSSARFLSSRQRRVLLWALPAAPAACPSLHSESFPTPLWGRTTVNLPPLGKLHVPFLGRLTPTLHPGQDVPEIQMGACTKDYCGTCFSLPQLSQPWPDLAGDRMREQQFQWTKPSSGAPTAMLTSVTPFLGERGSWRV